MSDALLDRLVNSPRLGLYVDRMREMQLPAPHFIADVLSTNTEATDRKFDDYVAHGVREYWIIDPDAELIEQYLLEGDVYVLHLKMNSGTLASRVAEGFEIPVRAIFDEKENLAALRELLGQAG